MSSRRAPSIRRIVGTTMLVPMVALTVLLVVLGALSARTAAERTGAASLRLATSRVQSELRGFLALPERLSAYASARLREDPNLLIDRQRGARFFAELMRAFPTPTVCVAARPDGSALGAIRDPDGLVLFEVQDGMAVERRLDERNAVLEPPLRSYPFDPRTRPWYLSAVEAPSPHWTRPYSFVRRDVEGFNLGTSFVRLLREAPPVGVSGGTAGGSAGETSGGEAVGSPAGGTRADAKAAEGVLAVDVTFVALSNFLREIAYGGGSDVLVVDDGLDILATSSGETTAEDGSLRRLSPALGGPLALRAAQRELEPQTSATRGERESIAVFDASHEGKRMLVAASPLAVEPGRDWHVVAMVPRSSLLQEARRSEAWLLLLSGVALASAIGGLLWLVARVSQPVERLQKHVQRLGSGEFPPPLDLRASRELEALSRDLNGMSAALQERMTMQRSLDLAREVQQALLPPPTLERPGLSLLGHIDYCDSAGGDYFDYIELVGRDAVLVAVGDVMGHGIASTILMATARAALRTEVRRAESLGAMLLRVSSVLLQGGRHGRFMTMFLIVIEPRKRRIRWANAGHDPALIVLPATPGEEGGEGARAQPEVKVLGGGDLPLGIDEGVVYFEQSMEDLPPGTLIYVGTDGIREAHGAGREEFGEARLHALLGALAERPLPEVRDGLLDAVKQFREGAPSKDDLTVVLARLGGT